MKKLYGYKKIFPGLKEGDRKREDSLADNPDYGIFIIADGLSGYAGDWASNTVISFLIRNLELFIESNKEVETDRIKEFIKENILEIDKTIAKLGGTTLDLLLIKDKYAYLTHLGDGKVYAVNENGLLKQITTNETTWGAGPKNYLGVGPWGVLDEKKLNFYFIDLEETKIVEKKLRGESEEKKVDENLFGDRSKIKFFFMATDGLDDRVSYQELENIFKNYQKIYSPQQIVDQLGELVKHPKDKLKELLKIKIEKNYFEFGKSLLDIKRHDKKELEYILEKENLLKKMEGKNKEEIINSILFPPDEDLKNFQEAFVRDYIKFDDTTMLLVDLGDVESERVELISKQKETIQSQNEMITSLSKGKENLISEYEQRIKTIEESFKGEKEKKESELGQEKIGKNRLSDILFSFVERTKRLYGKFFGKKYNNNFLESIFKNEKSVEEIKQEMNSFFREVEERIDYYKNKEKWLIEIREKEREVYCLLGEHSCLKKELKPRDTDIIPPPPPDFSGGINEEEKNKYLRELDNCCSEYKKQIDFMKKQKAAKEEEERIKSILTDYLGRFLELEKRINELGIEIKERKRRLRQREKFVNKIMGYLKKGYFEKWE